MQKLLKDEISKEFIEKLANEISKVYKDFDKPTLVKITKQKEWIDFSLKQRYHRVIQVLGKLLPKDFKKSSAIIKQIAPNFSGLQSFVFPEFISTYGLEHDAESLSLLKYLTRFGTSEFAIRPFLEKDQNRVMRFMLECAKDKNEHVRRFASEGCRPRLPWGGNNRSLIRNPNSIFEILTLLIFDTSEYVRKSVSNNLNDITKDHPKMVLEFVKPLIGKNKEIDKLIKHALRTLIKRGDSDALALFGFGNSKHKMVLKEVKLSSKEVKLNDRIAFEVLIHSENSATLRIDFIIHFLKKNGTHSKKAFKLKELEHKGGVIKVNGNYLFKDYTTRFHHEGVHFISFQLNGKETEKVEFNFLREGY